jgi:Tfp pilus assembly protein FimT
MKRGFTIIELLVSLGIFIIITTMVVANFRAGSRGDDLRISAEAMVSNLRKAQNMALAGQPTNDIIPPGGYGLYFNLATPDRYVIFADVNGNLAYDSGEALVDGLVTLPREVRITSVSPVIISTVVFKPPKPTIYINGGPTEAALSVTIKHTSSEQTRTVTVNRVSGRIDIE